MDEEGAHTPYLTWTRTCSFSVTALVLWVCLCCVFTQARWYKVLLVPVGRTPVSFSTFTPGFPLLCFSSRPLAWRRRNISKKWTFVKLVCDDGHVCSGLFQAAGRGFYLKDVRNKPTHTEQMFGRCTITWWTQRKMLCWVITSITLFLLH